MTPTDLRTAAAQTGFYVPKISVYIYIYAIYVWYVCVYIVRHERVRQAEN